VVNIILVDVLGLDRMLPHVLGGARDDAAAAAARRLRIPLLAN
jgi:hypothetical protein